MGQPQPPPQTRVSWLRLPHIERCSSLWKLDGNSLSLFDYQQPAASSTYQDDPFAPTPQPIGQISSSLDMFSSAFTNTSTNFFAQSQPQLVPARVPTPTLQTLSLNPATAKKNNDLFSDLLDFGEPSQPPTSPKFDPYA